MWFNEDKGYGAIECDGRPYIVATKEFQKANITPQMDMELNFDSTFVDGEHKAYNISNA